jgi:hypothetical protein
MSKPKLAAVVATISDRRPHTDPSNRAVFLVEIDEHYSMAAVQRFLDLNAEAMGGHVRARFELARFKSVRRLLAWTDRKRPGSPVALRGWHGPFRLAPAA